MKMQSLYELAVPAATVLCIKVATGILIYEYLNPKEKNWNSILLIYSSLSVDTLGIPSFSLAFENSNEDGEGY
jgi:hypothetical protein